MTTPRGWYNLRVSSMHAVRRPLAVGALLVSSLFALIFVLVSAPAVSNAQSAAGNRCGVLTVDNPSPGDRLLEGGYVVTGLAYDPTNTVASGISRVDFFLGSRDEGGVFLGSASPGGGADPRAYRATLSVPKVLRTSSGTTFVAYAYVDGSTGVTTVTVPVFVGPIPTATPNTFGTSDEPLGVTVSSNCQAVLLTPPAQVALATPTPPALAAPTAATASTNQGLVFQIANPNPGDLLQVGRYQISGLAYDPASPSGSGVDRIEFFLDPRDDGGILLGEGASDASGRTFSGEYDVPAGVRQKGPHTFTAYARSATTGREAVVSIPLYFGALPTATPHP